MKYNVIKFIHNKLIFERRIKIISEEILKIIADDISVLDVGCGDGSVSKLIMEKKVGVSYRGIDIMKRPTCQIPYVDFDGQHIPYPDNNFDAVQFIDVLHHTDNIIEILKEALRVSKKYLIIKDHNYNNAFDFKILQIMDWIGNKPHGVKLVYNYKNKIFWDRLFMDFELQFVSYNTNIGTKNIIYCLLLLKKYSSILIDESRGNLTFDILICLTDCR